MEITIYGKPDCVWCDRAKKLLGERGWVYKYVDIMGTPFVHRDFVHLTTVIAPGAKTVPIIVVDDVWIGGHDNLVEWLKGQER